MVKEYESSIVQPAGETIAGGAVWVAQVLAKGGDPTPQLKQAKALLHSLGGLSGLLKASPEQLVAEGPLDGQQMALLTAMQQVAGSSRSAGRPVIGSYRALECYLRKEGMEAGVAVTRALLLGDHHCLRADVVLTKGRGPLSVDQRRKLVTSCLEHGAFAAILARSAHRTSPSIIDLTREANVVACSLEMLEMRLLDYVLVGPSEIRRVRWYQSCAFAPGSLLS
jgi:DNA repair protein RadC